VTAAATDETSEIWWAQPTLPYGIFEKLGDNIWSIHLIFFIDNRQTPKKEQPI